MGDHGKLHEPGAVIPAWYWILSPFAYLWDPGFPRPSYRGEGRSALAVLIAAATLAL
jgi:hypothetical protein